MSFLNQIKKGAFPERKDQVYDGIRNPNEPHLAFLLLLDTSTSMGDLAGLKTKIQLLNEAIARLKKEMMMDEFASARVDIAVVEFNDGARVVCDWVPLSQFEAPVLEARGMTAMGEGGNLAIDMVKERRRFYKQMGTPSYQGHIFMITDGMPTDVTKALEERIKYEDSRFKDGKGKLKWISCAVPGADEKFLANLSERKVALETNNFSSLLNWIGKSMCIVSASDVNGGTGFAEFNEDIRRIPDNW
jgi:uncharacterized protein YegL